MEPYYTPTPQKVGWSPSPPSTRKSYGVLVCLWSLIPRPAWSRSSCAEPSHTAVSDAVPQKSLSVLTNGASLHLGLLEMSLGPLSAWQACYPLSPCLAQFLSVPACSARLGPLLMAALDGCLAVGEHVISPGVLGVTLPLALFCNWPRSYSLFMGI